MQKESYKNIAKNMCEKLIKKHNKKAVGKTNGYKTHKMQIAINGEKRKLVK